MIALRHLLSILLLPAVVAIAVPYGILASRPSGLAGWPTADTWTLAAALLGITLTGCGLALVGRTIRQFATEGRGTLAPWDPPKHLVLTGLYRHVRNPMISGVVLVLLGETLAFRSLRLLFWAASFWAINATYIPLLEEPLLERRFGEEYRQYRTHVPRWVPRRTAWTPTWAGENEGGEMRL
jgi:protein-S-isoprenylcysteine O-methyltransferase Ste14